jgi:hypothetical protein
VAKKVTRAKTAAVGGATDIHSDKPIVDILRGTVDHLRWLSWVGRGFDPGMPILLTYRVGDPEPPTPGTCGIPLSEISVGDLIEFVEAMTCDVAHVVGLLAGPPAAPVSESRRVEAKARRRPARRRALR